MGALVSLSPASATYDDRALALIKRTVAADCNDDEFNLFIHTSRHLGLDPLRRQIYAFVYNKTNAKKRRMSIIVAIDGFRSIAERTGNYRPDEEEPTYKTQADLKGPDNPAGLVKATVRVWKRAHGDWHKVTASAYWTEYAPLREEWSEYQRVDTGDTWPDGNIKYDKRPAEGAVKCTVLDTSGNWGKMPRLMLAKVAEALALRKAWPDDLGNVYAAEEVDRRAVDLLPSEAAAEGAANERLEKIGMGKTVLIQWAEHTPLAPVPVGQFFDRAVEFIAKNKEEPAAIAAWRDVNRHSLKAYWGMAPGDALELKKRIEEATASLREQTILSAG